MCGFDLSHKKWFCCVCKELRTIVVFALKLKLDFKLKLSQVMIRERGIRVSQMHLFLWLLNGSLH